MIKDHQQEFNRLQVVLDGLVIVVSYGLAWLLMINGFCPPGATRCGPNST